MRANDRDLSRVAATRRGVHGKLADLDLNRPHTYDARRTLGFRVEMVRQVTRRRTQISFGLMLVLPVIIACAFQFGGSVSASDGAPELVTLATVGASNFALFAIFAAVGFLLVVVAALFAGDTVASEASWASLRYLLAMPVPRARLLRQKLLVAATLIVAAAVLFTLWSYLIGGAFFGFAPARTQLAGTLGGGASVLRLLVIVGYICLQLFGVAAIAFFLGIGVDNPIGAVGGAVLFTVIGNILDQITALGSLRNFLLAHWDYSWTDALTAPIQWDDMIRGTGCALGYLALFLALAFLRFERKDITS